MGRQPLIQASLGSRFLGKGGQTMRFFAKCAFVVVGLIAFGTSLIGRTASAQTEAASRACATAPGDVLETSSATVGRAYDINALNCVGKGHDCTTEAL
jgi:hypothetical protein